jgi:hypothetical protein
MSPLMMSETETTNSFSAAVKGRGRLRSERAA